MGTAANWISNRPAKFAEERVICAGENFPEDQTTFDQDTNIYIVGGHCTPGADALKYLSTDIGYTDIAEAVSAACLKNTFPGKIKVYSCDSGTELSVDTQSFASKFADTMRAEPYGFARARFFGYRGLVTMSYLMLRKSDARFTDKVRYREEMERFETEVNAGKTAKLFTIGQMPFSVRYGGKASETQLPV